jgi:hypothetical protein
MTDHCDAFCPFWTDCIACRYAGGESVAAERVSAGQHGRIGAAKTNGPGRQPETVLATPIQASEQEDYPRW